MPKNKLKTTKSIFPKWLQYLLIFILVLPFFLGFGFNAWIGWIVGLFFGVFGIIASIISFFKKSLLGAVILLPISLISLVYGYQLMFYDLYNPFLTKSLESEVWIINQSQLRPWILILFVLLFVVIGGFIILVKKYSNVFKFVKNNMFKSIFGFFGYILILYILISESFILFNSTRKDETFVIQDKLVDYGVRRYTGYKLVGTNSSDNQIKFDVSKYIYNSINIGDKLEIIYKSPANELLKLRIIK